MRGSQHTQKTADISESQACFKLYRRVLSYKSCPGPEDSVSTAINLRETEVKSRKQISHSLCPLS